MKFVDDDDDDDDESQYREDDNSLINTLSCLLSEPSLAAHVIHKILHM